MRDEFRALGHSLHERKSGEGGGRRGLVPQGVRPYEDFKGDP